MLNANDQHSDPRPNPRPRPRTSYGALHSFFSRSSSDNAPNPLRPAASSCDLKRHTIVDLERSADSTLSTLQTTSTSQSYSPTSGSHRLEQKAVALGNSLRRRFSVVKSIRKHASVSRGRPSESEVAVQTSPAAVSPAVERRSSRIQRRSSSPEYANVRRPIFARDRFRRNAISFHPGQHTSRSSNELLELSQQQAPQQFAIGGGAGAKAAVAQMAEERKMQLQTRQDVLDQQKHMMLFGEPMEVDSAFGDESDEGVALTIPQPFVPIRKGKSIKKLLKNSCWLTCSQILSLRYLPRSAFPLWNILTCHHLADAIVCPRPGTNSHLLTDHGDQLTLTSLAISVNLLTSSSAERAWVEPTTILSKIGNAWLWLGSGLKRIGPNLGQRRSTSRDIPTVCIAANLMRTKLSLDQETGRFEFGIFIPTNVSGLLAALQQDLCFRCRTKHRWTPSATRSGQERTSTALPKATASTIHPKNTTAHRFSAFNTTRRSW